MDAFILFALPFDMIYIILDYMDAETFLVLALTHSAIYKICSRRYEKIIHTYYLRSLPPKFDLKPLGRILKKYHTCRTCKKMVWQKSHPQCIHKELLSVVHKQFTENIGGLEYQVSRKSCVWWTIVADRYMLDGRFAYSWTAKSGYSIDDRMARAKPLVFHE